MPTSCAASGSKPPHDVAPSLAPCPFRTLADCAAISINTASVNTHLKARDDHLRSADFLDVEKYPTMTFKSSKVKKLKDNLGEVTGAFTLHGVTKTITTEVTFIGETDVPWGQHRAGFETTFNIKRSDYGMEKLLVPAGDDIQITLLVEAMRVDKPKKKSTE